MVCCKRDACSGLCCTQAPFSFSFRTMGVCVTMKEVLSLSCCSIVVMVLRAVFRQGLAAISYWSARHLYLPRLSGGYYIINLCGEATPLAGCKDTLVTYYITDVDGECRRHVV
jgi:hypothetical protein